MKLTTILYNLKNRLTKYHINGDIFLKSVVPICTLLLISAVIWFTGPYLVWHDFAPFALPEKRIYLILFLFLIWTLKFLIVDLEKPAAWKYKDPQTRKKVQTLQSRFNGAIQFLKKKKLQKYGKSISLNELPWYLLVGPSNAGKTTLLANSGVNFVLQRQFQDQNKLEQSDYCDWWVTKDASIIDVPGKYLNIGQPKKLSIYTILWRFFLRLIKNQRGKHGLAGIIIALPLPEIMKQENSDLQDIFENLFSRLAELQKIFSDTIPCHLIITKCDLLPGFAQYFAESSNDEISQAWGIVLSHQAQTEKVGELFSSRFDTLIKKLNQQLLWRLHQERNPMLRPFIKDFPLQVEQLKEFIFHFVKNFCDANDKLFLQSVYLVSAMQVATNNKATIQEINRGSDNLGERSIQIFKSPSLHSRAYFIKQFITHGLGSTPIISAPPVGLQAWKKPFLMTTSFIAIVVSAIFLWMDFEQGAHKAYFIQNNLANFQLSIQTTHDPDEHLHRTLALLNNLQHSTQKVDFKLKMRRFFNFYSDKSQANANAVYNHALKIILIPQVKNYFAEFLKVPVNKNTDHVYAVLKAYLMMGDAKHFDEEFVLTTFKEILPRSLNDKEVKELVLHVTYAMNSLWRPQELNSDIIQATRRYLLSLPNLQLAFTILKNFHSNNTLSEVNLGTNAKNESIFVSKVINQIPSMFTAKSFTSIISEQTISASQESLFGNWTLGAESGMNKDSQTLPFLVEQLRLAYINNYVDVWESLLANIHLSTGDNLPQIDTVIVSLLRNDSPLLQLLQTLHDNTYFEPIATYSPKLQSLGELIAKNTGSENTLYQIFTGLQSMHQFIQAILKSKNEKRAAFYAVSNRMKNPQTPDAIMQLRIIAAKSPEPIKNWLDKISNNVWRLLMQDASHYIDTSWQNDVHPIYQNQIANRYPFNMNGKQEVDLPKFIEFFGNPGVVMNFFNEFLEPFIDSTGSEWHWKTIDGHKLALSQEVLQQMQYALRIHQTFFPKGDNNLNFQFSFKPYKFDKQIKSVTLKINNKKFMDQSKDFKIHFLEWPSNEKKKITSVQLNLVNHRVISLNYPGNWGLFKLIRETFAAPISNKQMLINLSANTHTAKYVLTTDGTSNPFLSLNLNNFYLPKNISDEVRS